MYKGINSNEGIKVHSEDALEYAMNKCHIKEIGLSETKDSVEFRKMLVDWFFSGDWIEVDDIEY